MEVAVKIGGCVISGLLAAAVLCAPIVSYADVFVRDGGKAYHVKSSCPALRGYKVKSVNSTDGLTPCRVCCPAEFERMQARSTVGMKLDQPRAKSFQELSGTKKKEEPAAQSVNRGRYYGRAWNPVRSDLEGDFVVSNGQRVDLNSIYGDFEGGAEGGGFDGGGFDGGGCE